jgi:predicted secreted protein
MLGGRELDKNYHFLITVMVLSLFLSACTSNVSAPGSNTIVVTPAINGNSVSMKVGDVLEIQIPTLPTPGYEWRVQDTADKILLQNGSAVYTEDSSPDSAGGITSLKFGATQTGTTTLVLLYSNSPSNGEPALSSNSFSIVVDVK